ncbi:MAG: PRC-barrel domain-containing protein [Thermoplasmata archaeon]|nr:PRC-barrel domain-containing protein [Thermoplasmata archaeon]HDD59789.1 photosystem reaction center subunit H [Euryarchaeota archaeon]RLF56288.1 MAG: photosystem reaction center subunit H [Thermoplasmata archaeon]RLF71240.1 MAG: photosystem reaction center subunit H [Thermoplasmata archaeon]RLF72309.1 MAG: photosystem reaction center subunit H [Thermoplasmata archaeon]
MLTEITNLYGLEVITNKGVLLGYVDRVIIDVEKGEIYEVVITNTNPELVEGGLDVGIPFRWIQSISRVILLRYFPGRIRRKMPAEGAYPPRTRRKLRVVRKPWGEGGISRVGWH